VEVNNINIRSGKRSISHVFPLKAVPVNPFQIVYVLLMLFPKAKTFALQIKLILEA
jgi:hypothetical protein